MTKHFYAKPAASPAVINALPAHHHNAVVCGDSLDVLAAMPDNCIDAVITSPPYKFGMDYDAHDDAGSWRDYFRQLNAILDECVRVLVPGGRLAVNVQPMFSDYVPTHHMISGHLTGACGMIWRNEILWEKHNYSAKVSSWGSWMSPASPYLKYTWEFVEVFAKGSVKKEPRIAGSKPDMTAEEFKAWTTPAKWSIAPERSMAAYGHPAMMPLALADRLVRLYTFPGDVVADPFSGAGTTLVAANDAGRTWVGIDISEAYCDTARSRLAGPAMLEPDE